MFVTRLYDETWKEIENLCLNLFRDLLNQYAVINNVLS